MFYVSFLPEVALRGLKDKHMKPLLGKPLIVYTIEAAFESRLINKIVVSTDGPEIAKIATKYKVQVINIAGNPRL